jgi:hypothetical protein
MLDPTESDLILLADARKRLPGGKGRCQMRLYARRGILSRRSGERIFLETVWLPGGEATSAEAWRRFLLALNRGRNDPTTEDL